MSAPEQGGANENETENEPGLSAFEATLVRWSVPLFPAILVVAAAIMGAIRGAPGAVLILAGGVLIMVIAAFWQSIRVLTGEAALSLEASLWHGETPGEDEKKQAVLRALKDLEYERSVGKLSEDDYRELSLRYRTEAKALLRAQDAALAPAREKAEEIIAKKRRGEPIDAVAKAAGTRKKKSKKADDLVKQVDEETSGAAESDIRVCPSCAVENDEDAKFCKGCGGPL
jgi:hypothetical protein